ncbi:MAG: hypothetical protein HUK40_22485 [Desulfobacter sp.]|nr:hypothetical protein [Desulfobacter sp.]
MGNIYGDVFENDTAHAGYEKSLSNLFDIVYNRGPGDGFQKKKEIIFRLPSSKF